MKSLVAACFALIALTGCAQGSSLDDRADGKCSNQQGQLVQDHISGQIDALSRQDWESAYSYAAPGFQENVGLEQFSLIIAAQYQMLIDNQGVAYGACSIAGEIFTQSVNVRSESRLFELTYSLSYDGKKLGIESASTTISQSSVDI
jgi:hypothetical protein